MNGIDIVVLIILVYGAYRGYCNGLIVELCGILGVIVGAYVAYNFCDEVAKYFSLSGEVSVILSFIAILLAVFVVVSILARLFSTVLSFGGLGIVNGLLGMVASVIKVAVVLSLLSSSFISLNSKIHWVEESTINKSEAIPKLRDVSRLLFPYIGFFEKYYDKILESIENNESDESSSDKSNGKLV